MFRRELLIAAALSVVSSGAFAQDTVKIGLILPMTGQQASTGKQIDAAVKLYQARNGTTVAGKKVEVILKDDTGVPDVAKRLAQELVVNDKVAVLAGFGLTPIGAGHGADRHPGQGAGGGDGGRHVVDHRGLALRRAHQLHAGAVGRADGRMGGQERHQEGRDPGHRLRPRHRRREVVQREVQGRRRHDRREPARAAAQPRLRAGAAEGGRHQARRAVRLRAVGRRARSSSSSSSSAGSTSRASS